jgi:hypothetical protein
LHLLVAQGFSLKVGGDGVDGCLVAKTIIFRGVDACAGLLVAVPLLPGVK